MNQPDAFDANSFFLALEFGVGTLVIFGKPIMRRWFPKFDETWFEGSAFGLATLILMWFAFRRVVRVPDVRNVVVFCVPYIVVALWILVMLRFSSAVQTNKKRIEEVFEKLSVVKLSERSEATDRRSSPLSQHEEEITRAVHGRLQKSEYFSFSRSVLGSAGFFLEYSQHDPSVTYFSDTFAIREVSDPIVTPEIGRHIRAVSRLVADKGTFRNVIVVLLVYRSLRTHFGRALPQGTAAHGTSRKFAHSTIWLPCCCR